MIEQVMSRMEELGLLNIGFEITPHETTVSGVHSYIDHWGDIATETFRVIIEDGALERLEKMISGWVATVEIIKSAALQEAK